MTPNGPPPRSRQDENRLLWRSFRHHSRTFSLAARFLPRPVRLPVATLYLFCRTVDNLADERVLEVGAEAALAELDALQDALGAALDGRPGDELLWRRLAEVHEAHELHVPPLFELIDGARWDLEGRGVADDDELIGYSNLVGGTVGAMMLPFLVDDRAEVARLDRPARALGIGMQITNILRDVGEDLRLLDRMYLPRTRLRSYGLTADQLREGRSLEHYPLLLEALMETAEAYYAEGFAGIEALVPGARRSICAAGRMYREIMNEVRRRHYDNLTQRAYVTLPRKLRLVFADGYEKRRDRLRLRARPALAYT